MKERNADYRRIMTTFVAKAPKKWLVRGHSLRLTSAGGGAVGGTALAATVNTIESYLAKANAVNNEWFDGFIGAVGLPPDHRAPSSTVPHSRPLLIRNGKKSRGMPASMELEKKKKKNKFSKKKSKKASKGVLTAWADTSEPPFEAPFDGLLFMGDLNYRVDYPRRLIEAYIKKVHTNATVDTSTKRKKLDAILRHDQLGMERQKNRVFEGFSEHPISFLPTFKYDVGSDQFDSSEKKRCPAWTDRVLYCAKPNGTLGIHQDAYYSIDSKHSDHRPVCAHFSLFF